MILVSNHLLSTTPVIFPKETVVIRINIAWIKTKQELVRLLKSIEHDVYLDYPQGRSKPPRPVLTIDEAIEMAHKFPHVKYFAVSNVENPQKIFDIKSRLPAHVEVVPKIETATGVKNMLAIIKKLDTNYVMLDKEDLYSDIQRNSKRFATLVETARRKAKEANIDLLELHGVVFAPYKKR